MNILDFTTGVSASIIAAFLWEKIASKIPTTNKFGGVDIRGIWVGKVPYRHRTGRQGYNIYKINECRGNIKSYIEHHSKAENGQHKSVKLFGIGVFNDPVVSIAYRFDRSIVKQSGVMIGRIQSFGMVGDVINANYSQYFELPNGTDVNIKLITEEYILFRVKLPIKNQLRLLFGLKYFSSAYEFEKYYLSTMERINNCITN